MSTADPESFSPRRVEVDDDIRHVTRGTYLPTISSLREHGYLMCIDVTAVDYLNWNDDRALPDGVKPERFEIVTNLISHAERHRIRIRVQVPEGDPVVESLYDLYPGTEAMEREVYDMFGIRFNGHPDLSRILMPEDWEGHPLRKDFAQGRIPVQFKFPEGAYEARGGQS